tara:strand:- start:693 stop:2987 length:2295 start_codon:yes stop_codon:yes gene_type:complete
MELTSDQALQKGVEAHKAGNLQEADRYYTGILKANPKHPDANHNMGVLAVGIGKVEAALPFFKTALEVNQTIAQFWLSYIDALIRLDRIADAKAVFDQAKSKGAKGDGFDQIEKRFSLVNVQKLNIQDPSQNQIQNLTNLYNQGRLQETINQAAQLLVEFPNSPNLYNIIGTANKGLGELEKAIEAYGKVVSLKPDLPEPFNNIGNALLDQGKIDEAIISYTKAISIKPEYAEAYTNMGNALRKQCKLEEALEAYTKAIVLKPDHPNSYFNMGNAFQDQGKLEEAIKAYTKAIELKPDYARAYNNLGFIFHDQGKLEEAVEAYSKTVSISPDLAYPFHNMGNVFLDQGKIDEAIKAYEKAISVNPEYAEAYSNMGNALRIQCKFEEAIAAYTKAILLKPQNADFYYNMGNARKDQGKLEEAIEAYTQAIGLKPDYAGAYNNLGVIFHDQGKLEKAEEAYRKVVSFKPNLPEPFNNMGNALLDQGKIDEAIKAYEKAISIKPEYTEAYTNMGNALNRQGKIEKAIEAYSKAITFQPGNGDAKHMLSALTGKTCETAPRDYVRSLFDRYAKKFENSLVDKLEYKIPNLTKDILITPKRNETLGSVLDLGCGTGLLGPEIKPHCSKIEGVDLSLHMLEIAKQKNVYDKLSQFDIAEYLSSMPLDFDYYIALDVFIYIGELSEIFRLIRLRNRKPGHLVFSTEHTEVHGYHILKSGRYSHSKSYIEDLCTKFGYNISHFSTTDLRKENEHFLTGGIYVLSFPTRSEPE